MAEFKIDSTNIIALLEASAETLKKVSATVVKLSSIDVETFIKSENNLKKIIPGVNAFVGQVTDIIKMLSDDDILKGNTQELVKLFIDANEYVLNKDGSIKLDSNKQKTIIKEGFTIPSIIAAISSSITNMSKSMEEMSNIGFDITGSTKFKLSIILFKHQLRDILDTISDMLDDDSIKKTLFNSKTNLKGTISVFEQLNELFKVIENYGSVKNIFATQKASWVTMGLYYQTNDKGHGLLVQISSMLTSVTWSELKSKTTQKSIDDVNKTFKSLLKLTETINEICENLISSEKQYIGAKRGIRRTKKLFAKIKELVDHINALSLDIQSQNTDKSITEIASILGGVAKICASASLIALLFMPASIGLLVAHVILWEIHLLVKTINKISVEIDKDGVTEGIIKITAVMGAIAGLCAVAALTGILIIELWKETLVGLGFIYVMLWLLIPVLLVLSNKKFQSTSIQASLSLLVLTGVLILMNGVVLLAALVGAIMLQHQDLIIPGLIVLGTSLVILVALAVIASMASPVFLMGAIALAILASTLLVLEIAVMMLVAVVGVLNLLDEVMISDAMHNLKTLLIGDDQTQTPGIISVLAGCAGHILEMLGAMIVLTFLTVISIELMVVTVAFLGIAALLKDEPIKDASDNISLMINSFIKAIDIFSGKGVGGSAKLLAKISGALVVFTQLMIIAGCIAAMASVVRNIAELDIAEFDDEGHPTGKRVKMSPEMFAEAAVNASNIARFFVDLVTPGFHDVNGASFNGLDLDNLKQVSLSTTAKMVELNTIVGSIGNMAETIQNVASLMIPEFDDKGHPTGKKRQMEEKDFEKATNNICKIATLFVNSLGVKQEDLGNKSVLEYVSDFKKRDTKKLKTLFSIGDGISHMVDAIVTLNEKAKDITFEGKGGIEQMLQNIVSIPIKSALHFIDNGESIEVVDVIAEVHSNWEKIQDISNIVNNIVHNFKPSDIDTESYSKDLESIVKLLINNGLKYVDNQGKSQDIGKNIGIAQKNWTNLSRIAKSTSSIIDAFSDKKIDADSHQKFVESNIKFIDKANTIDVDKIKTVTEMFGQMTAFSKSLNGNIEDLAKVLSEDLVDALNELNGIMKGTSDNVEKVTAVGTSMSQDSKTTSVPSTSTPIASQSVDLSGVESKLNDIVNKLSRINTNIEDMQ